MDSVVEHAAARGTVFLDVSGGKDSVAAAVYAVEAIRGRVEDPNIVMLYVETPLAHPDNRGYLEGLAGILGVPLVVARPREGLEAIPRRGWPLPWRRWCTHRWKLEPLVEAASRYPRPHLHVIGVRWGESTARMIRYSKRDPGRPWRYCLGRYCAWYWAPILAWTVERVYNYLRERGIPANPLWGRGHSSPDCVICLAYARRRDYAELRARDPGLWRRILAAYRELKARLGASGLALGRLDLEELERARTIEEYL